MEEDNFDFSSDNEAFEAVQKFEAMKKNNTSCFFDVIEFESIIDYYIERANYTRAYEAASLASQQHPNSIPIQLRKARVLIDRGRAVEAMSILKKIEQIEPGNYEIYIAKGTAFGILGDINGAKKMFDYALSLESDDEEESSDILFSIVSVLQNLNYYEQSIPYLKRLIEIEPSCSSHLYDMAYAYERIEDYDNSIKYYLLYLDEEPYSDNAWYNLGIIYNKKGEYDKAIEAYD
ncbi:MAG: tetratricopeptide repeat protein, partial [Bacteroidales bacterium]|nr:tetratricopeptide repeat protein [Bacteroidales bacterium]